MKLIKLLGAVLAAALALTAFASTASATTLEVGGVAKNEAVAIKATLKSGTSLLWTDTFGAFVNTATGSTIELKTASPFTGTTVGGPVTSLSWSPIVEGPLVVDAAGTITFESITGTTNATVRWIGTKVTMPSPFGNLTCTTAASPGTDVGTLTGVASGNATLDINAVLNCALITTKWSGTYSITSPLGLGVRS